MNIIEGTTTGSSESIKRWHRPNLYVTIVGIYLLVLTTFMGLPIGYLGYLTYQQEFHPEPCLGPGICWPMFIVFPLVILFLAPLLFFSIRGARRILKLRYKGFRDALVSLIYCTVPIVFYFSFGIFYWITGNLEPVHSDPYFYLLSVATVLTAMMYGFLMMARKTVQWHSD